MFVVSLHFYDVLVRDVTLFCFLFVKGLLNFCLRIGLVLCLGIVILIIGGFVIRLICCFSNYDLVNVRHLILQSNSDSSIYILYNLLNAKIRVYKKINHKTPTQIHHNPLFSLFSPSISSAANRILPINLSYLPLY